MAAGLPNCEAKENNMQEQVKKFGDWLLQALARPEMGGTLLSVGIVIPMLTDQSWQVNWE